MKTRSFGLNTSLGRPALSQKGRVTSLVWKIVLGPRLKVSSEGLEKPGIELTDPGLHGE